MIDATVRCFGTDRRLVAKDRGGCEVVLPWTPNVSQQFTIPPHWLGGVVVAWYWESFGPAPLCLRSTDAVPGDVVHLVLEMKIGTG